MTGGTTAEARRLFTRPGFLDEAACARIRGEARQVAVVPATVVRHGAMVVDRAMRRAARVKSVSADPQFRQCLEALKSDLAAHFEMTLSAFDAPTFLRYGAGDFFRPHRDSSESPEEPVAIRRRRVTVIVFLNDPADHTCGYSGGELVVYSPPSQASPLPGRTRVGGATGLLVAFPSDLYHEVTRVRWGERFTAVTWFH